MARGIWEKAASAFRFAVLLHSYVNSEIVLSYEPLQASIAISVEQNISDILRIVGILFFLINQTHSKDRRQNTRAV